MSPTAPPQPPPPQQTTGDDDDESDLFIDEDDGRAYHASVAKEPRESLFWGKLAILVVVVLHLGFLVYYFGWVFTLIKFQDEYTGWVTPPPPGVFIQRAWQDWQWYCVMWLVLNVFPPFATMLAINNVYVRVRSDFSRLVSMVTLIVTFLVLGALIAMWLLGNSQFVPFNIAHSDDYCCRYYGSVAGSGRCRNTGECTDAPSATVQLALNTPFVHLIVGPVFLILFCALEYGVIDAVRTYARALKNSGQTDVWHSKFLRAWKKIPGLAKFALTLAILAYIALIVCYVLLGPLSIDIRHTHQYPAVGPTGIQSARDSVAITGIVISMTILLMPFLAMLSVHVTGRTGWSFLVAACMITLVALHIFSFMTMVYTRGTANTPGQPNNIANSELYCCVPEVYNNPLSQCDNNGPCVLPLASHPDVTVLPAFARDLQPNKVHTIMLSFMAGFVGLDLVLIALVLITSMWTTVSKAISVRKTVDHIASYIASPIGLSFTADSPLQAKAQQQRVQHTATSVQLSTTTAQPRFSATGYAASNTVVVPRKTE